MASWTHVLWNPKTSHRHDTEGFYSQRAQRGRKRGDTACMFSEWRVSEVRTCFLAETMAQVLPAAFSLLLALPVRISLSPSEQKHTAHPARNNTPSQKFTSCASALLLHADPIPKTCIYNPPHTEMALGCTSGYRSRKNPSPSNTP